MKIKRNALVAAFIAIDFAAICAFLYSMTTRG